MIYRVYPKFRSIDYFHKIERIVRNNSHIHTNTPLQCPRNPTTMRSVFGDTGRYGDKLKTSTGDPSRAGEPGRPTLVECNDGT